MPGQVAIFEIVLQVESSLRAVSGITTEDRIFGTCPVELATM
jgi:hypothetical protein